MIKDGRLHCHTEYSICDASMSVKTLVNEMHKQGARACAITDHGNLLGVQEFIEECENTGIKAIIGCELFIISDEDAMQLDNGNINTLPSSRMQHLIVLGKNDRGEQKISLAVSKANERVITRYKVDYPLLSESETAECFKDCKGDIFATSACMGGVIGSCFLVNSPTDKEMAKLKAKIKKTTFKKDLYMKYVNGISVDAEISERKKKRTSLKRAVKTHPENEDIILSIEKELEDLKKINEVFNLEKELDKLKCSRIPLEDIRNNAKNKLAFYKSIFGADNFFIELQYHYDKEEAFIMRELYDLAQKTGTKLLCANDEHMAHHSDYCFTRTALLRSIRFDKYSPLSEESKHLYIKTDEELKKALLEILPLNAVIEGMKNIGYIIDNCNARRPKGTYYPKYPCDGETADTLFRKNCMEGLKKLGLSNKKDYLERLHYEMDVICKMGYSDYLLIVADYIKFGRQIGRLDKKQFEYLRDNCHTLSLQSMKEYVSKHATGYGFTVGTGRGSSAGSLACYCLGITTLDPIKLNLLFERFLNPERVSMPDIDVDFAKETRIIVMEYVRKKYGYERCCMIASANTLGTKGSIRTTASLLAKVDESKKTVYYNAQDRVLSAIGNEMLADSKDKYLSLFANDTEATQIIQMASSLEGAINYMTTHPAGLIISDNEPIRNHIPLMWDTEAKTYRCQCDMVQAENKGLLKMDFLGLKNLSIITKTVKKVKENRGIDIDILKIPYDDKNIYDELCKGNTLGVFQLESDGMMEMLKGLKPKCFEDIILGIAIYRPGPMENIPNIIAVKNGKIKPKYPIPSYAGILDVTYGYPVYQEQLMQMFNAVGFSFAEADNVRRAMSKKKTEKFIGYKDEYIKRLMNNGATQEDAEKMWDDIVSFALYAFNKSHSAVYGAITYITAYLKYYYTAEYMSEVLNYLDSNDMDKIAEYVKDMKQYGVTVETPDINLSEKECTVTGNTIRYGLSNVKNVGNAINTLLEARQYGGFKSLTDFIDRAGFNKKVIENLAYGGAFDSFGKNREGIITYLTAYSEIRKEYLCNQEEIQKQRAMLNVVSDKELDNATKLSQLGKLGSKVKNVPKPTKYIEKIAELNVKMAHIKENMDALSLDDYNCDEPNRLNNEKMVLGTFLTGNPLDGYPMPQMIGCTPVSQVEQGKLVSIMGIISSFAERKRKKDGKPMGFFTLEDVTSSISVCAFTECYGKYADNIKNGRIVKITGIAETDKNTGILKIYAEKINPVPKSMQPILIHCNSIMDFAETVYPQLKKYEVGDVLYPLMIHDRLFGELRKTTYMVNEHILESFKGTKL